jgi:hypothetical protein
MKFCAAFKLPTLELWGQLRRPRLSRLNGAVPPDDASLYP